MDDPRRTDRLPVQSTPQTNSPQGDRTDTLSGDGAWLEGPAGRIDDPDRPRERSRKLAWFRSILVLLVLAVPLFLFLVAGAVYWQARTDEARPADAIVVLGAAQYNGRPSPVLSARLDHALALYDRELAPVIVLTGGRASGDVYSEAEAGRLYLEERGVPSSAMVIENEGRDTLSTMRGVAEVLEDSDISRLLLVSDGFHLLRSELMARHFGFEAHSSAAPDGPIRPWSGSELAYVIRETGGILAFLPTMF